MTPARRTGRTLTFVTGNKGKMSEVARLVAPLGWTVAQDAGGYPEVQADSLEQVTEHGANALLARGVPTPFILEDSGLFVDALHGFPGVYSRHALDTIGVAGLLRLLADVPPAGRSASFKADLLLVTGAAVGARLHFEGVCRGTIAKAAAGTGGFGFDPVFVPNIPEAMPELASWGGRTFADAPPRLKDALSHRAQAVAALGRHLAPGVQTAKP